jgi:hypothetical protein
MNTDILETGRAMRQCLYVGLMENDGMEALVNTLYNRSLILYSLVGVHPVHSFKTG